MIFLCFFMFFVFFKCHVFVVVKTKPYKITNMMPLDTAEKLPPQTSCAHAT